VPPLGVATPVLLLRRNALCVSTGPPRRGCWLPNWRSGRREGTFRALQLQRLAMFRSLTGDSEHACRAMQAGGGGSSRRGAVRELLLRGFLFGLLRWQFASQPSTAAEKLGDDEFAIEFDEGPRESACLLASGYFLVSASSARSRLHALTHAHHLREKHTHARTQHILARSHTHTYTRRAAAANRG
jgi:hypothetical protein